MQDKQLIPYLLQPSPELPPAEVIKIQLKALKRNRKVKNNLGIAAAFVFASPANKMHTGPLERFIRMVKNPVYHTMLNHKEVHFDPIVIDGDTAMQRVILIDDEDQPTIFIFTLSRQGYGPYWNCWMTDSVLKQ